MVYYCGNLCSFLIQKKTLSFKFLVLVLVTKASVFQAVNLNYKINIGVLSNSTIEQSSLNPLDSSLARRIREKQNATTQSVNFIPGTALAKTTAGQPEQDCSNAIPICQNAYNTSVSYLGSGSVVDIPSFSSCLATNETNSVWYTFTTGTSGNLAFQITPYDLNDDYDFALYDVTGNNCSGISSGLITPIRCNFSATRGSTGLSASGVNPSESAAGINQNTTLISAIGETYVLVICNYSSSLYGYNLNFATGTATVFDNTAPAPQSISAPCGSSIVTFNTSEQIKCSSIATNASDFILTGTGGPYVISSAIGKNCGVNSSQIDLTISPLLSGSGPWTLGIVSGSDGNTLSDICGNNMAVSTITFALAPPNIIITGNTALCSGGTTTLTASGANTYTWSSGTNSSSIIITPSVSTTYTLIGNITSLGCSGTIIKSVTVFTNSISISPTTQTICEGSLVTLSGFGAQTYTWANGISSGSSSGTVLVQPIINTTYTLTGTNTCGTYTTTTLINVTPISGSITCSPSSSICSGNSRTLTATGGTSYVWVDPSASLSSTNTPITIASPTSSTSYSLIITNASGCSRTYNQKISVYTNSVGISPVTQTICEGSSASLSVTGAQTYTWNTGSTLASIVVQPTVNTSYSLSGTNLCGTYTNSALIYVTPISATITSSPSFSICSGGSTTLTAIGGTSYAWSQSTAVSATNTPVVIVSPTNSATYLLTVTNSSGCFRKYSQKVIVYTNGISITPVAPQICKGFSTVLTGIGAQTYTWNTGSNSSSITVSPLSTSVYTLTGINPCGTFSSNVNVTVNTLTTSISSNPSFSICPTKSTSLTATGGVSYTWSLGTSLSSTTSSMVVATPSASTIYTLTAISSAGCVKTNTVLVFVSPIYTVSSSASQPSICIGKNSLLSVSGALSYSWSPANSLSSSLGSSVIATPSISSVYTITSANALGCIQTHTQRVYIYPDFSVAINGLLSENCVNTPINLMANIIPTGSYNFKWTPPNLLSADNIFNPTLISPLVGKNDYLLIVTDQFGCVKKDSITINSVYCEMKTYSGFTPNNDGHNDTWIIDGIEMVVTNEVTILNKWGQVVWETKDYNNLDRVFKGNNKTGEALTDGTYFFVLSVSDKTYKGRVEIIR